MTDRPVGLAIDPTDSDRLVLTFIDNNGTATRYEPDLTAWAGTPANLTDPTALPTTGVTVDAGGQVVAGAGDGVTTPLLLNLDPAVSLNALAAPAADLSIGGQRLLNVANASANSEAPNWGQVQSLPGRVVGQDSTIAGLPDPTANVGHYAILTAIDGSDVPGLYEASGGAWVLRIEIGGGAGGGHWVDVTEFGASTARTDNEVPINAAIASLGGNGGFIYIPEWLEVSAPVIVNTDATILVGAGWFDFPTAAGLPSIGSGIYAGSSFAGTEVVHFRSDNVDGRPVLGSGMRDMMVFGPALEVAAPAGVVAVRARVARGHFDRCYFTRATSHGLLLEGASIANGDGVDWSTYDTNVTNCQSSHNGGDGLHTNTASADTKINNFQALDNTGDGIHIQGASHEINHGHVYGNRSGIYTQAVRTWIKGVKVEDNLQHGVHAQSAFSVSGGLFVGGLVISGGCGFRNNGTSAADTYDDVFIESDQSDGPWQVTGNRFSQGPSTARYAVNMSPQMNQGLISGNSVEGTYGTGVVNQTALGVAAGAFANRQVGNAVGFGDPTTATGAVQPTVWFKHSSAPTDTFTDGDNCVFTQERADNNGAGNIGLSADGETIELAANTGQYEVTVFADTEAPANGDSTTVYVLVDAAAFTIMDISLTQNQTGSWSALLDTTGAQRDVQVQRAIITGTGRLDVQTKVVALD